MSIKKIRSCKIATALISKSLDVDLSLKERLFLNLHLMMCNMCINYRRQLKSLKKTLPKYLDAISISPPPAHNQLSDKKKKQIIEFIELSS